MSKASSRSNIRWLSCVMAGLLLVTQLARAAEACVLAQISPAGASQPAMAMAMEGCDGMPMDRDACRVRCLAADQSVASFDQHFPLPPPSAALGRANFPLREIGVSPAPQPVSCLPGGPPLRTLYCSYRN